MLAFYEGLMTLGKPAVELLLSLRRRRGREDPDRLGERRGVAALPRPNGQLVWVHAASVGEITAALALIERLLEAPRRRHVLVTTGTVSSATLIGRRLPSRARHQFAPVDRPAWVRRFLDHWRPDLAVVMESDFWPAQLSLARARDIPVVVANGRMSKASFRRWRLASPLIRPLFSSLDLVLATNPDQAARFRALGAPRVRVVGNLKRAAKPLPDDPAAVAMLSGAIAGRAAWCAASTRVGEEAIVLDAHCALRRSHPDLLTVVAPRHPARGPELAERARGRGLTPALRSAGEPITPDVDLYIADTLGEMAVFFRLVPIVFVAGSLVPVGGHNPLEPAHFDCAILFGPLMANNQETAADMIKCGAAVGIAGPPALAPTVGALLDDSPRRLRMARSAQRYVEDGADVLDQVFSGLEPFLARSQADPPG